jgi:hypothetical protein
MARLLPSDLSHLALAGAREPELDRSPDSIARFIRRMLPFTFECANDLPGLGVGVTTYSRPAEQPALVGATIHRLLDPGFTHDDIVILTLHGAANSIFSACDKVGGYPPPAIYWRVRSLRQSSADSGQDRVRERWTF